VRFTQYVFRMRRCAMTVVLDEPGDRLLRMRRHRFIVYRWVWELPGGYVDDGEDSLAAAARGVGEDLLDAEDDTDAAELIRAVRVIAAGQGLCHLASPAG
jgi:predicted NUDIX family NTP pyrophosphohydrolase